MKFLQTKNINGQFFLQIAAAAIFMYVVLFSLDEVSSSRIIWAAGASSLASSAYLVFCVPHCLSARPWHIVGGYIIGMLCGLAGRFLAIGLCQIFHVCDVNFASTHIFELTAMFAVGLSLFIMVLLNSEHPPAAGFAVVMVLNIRSMDALMIILGAAVFLALVEHFLGDRLKNLANG